jgi:hypothetical protein
VSFFCLPVNKGIFPPVYFPARAAIPAPPLFPAIAALLPPEVYQKYNNFYPFVSFLTHIASTENPSIPYYFLSATI